MSQAQRAVEKAHFYTAAEILTLRAAAFREGYGEGAENTQLEVRRKPFLIEDEAVDSWLSRQ